MLFSQFLVPFETVPARYIATSLIIFVVAVVVDSVWLAVGSAVRSIFTHPKTARATRVLFGLSIVIATGWTLLS